MAPERTSLLASTALFSGLTPETLRQVADICAPRSFALEDWIFLSGDVAESAYLVTNGQLGVYRKKGDQEIKSGTLGTGDLTGEISLVIQSKRMVSLRAERDCHLLEIRRDDFHPILSSSPALARKLNLLLQKSLKDFSKEMDFLRTRINAIPYPEVPD